MSCCCDPYSSGGSAAGAGSVPDTDPDDIIRVFVNDDDYSGADVTNLGSTGAADDLDTNDGTDVFQIAMTEENAGVSTNNRYYKTASGTGTAPSGGFTVHGWIRLTNTTSNLDRVLLKQTSSSWSGSPIFGFGLLSDGLGGLDVIVNGGGTVTNINTGDDIDPSAESSWRYMAVVINAAGDTMNAYVNGSRVITNGAIVAPPVWGTGPWVFGGREGITGQEWPGNYFDWRVTEREMTRDEFRARMRQMAPILF